MEPKTDLELIQEVRGGDRRAFTELMRRYQERVYWVSRRIVGSHEDADDVAQETFVKAYVGLGDFRGDSSFFTWLYRIAVNLSLNTIRKRQVVSYLEESPLLNRLLLSRDDPHERVVQRDLLSKLEKAVALLPDRQRSVFVLRYFEELPYEEIAKILKTSVGGLKANYFHAAKKVRQVLKHEILDHDTPD
jgi:RNA polymerase sigma-70 factor, ECF subfamily